MRRKLRRRRTLQTGGENLKYTPLSAPLPRFMSIYFQYFTVINFHPIYAEVGRCATTPAAHLKFSVATAQILKVQKIFKNKLCHHLS